MNSAYPPIVPRRAVGDLPHAPVPPRVRRGGWCASWVRLLLGLLVSLASGLVSDAAGLETGLHYYAIVDLSRGDVVQRGRAGENGIAFDQLILGPRRPYRIFLLQASTFRVAEQSLVTPNSGFTFVLAPFTLYPSRTVDTDGDGLPDDGELVMGTDPRRPDTDGDGLSDAAEVRQGGDPLSGLAVRTGLLASVQTAGRAIDVAVENNAAFVALGDRGVAMFNVFAGLNPVLITQVDTPGDARRVAASGTWLAVADGPAGLAVVDIADPPAATVARQVPLNDTATAVATAGFLGFVGLEGGEIAVVDMTTGAVLARRWLGAPVADLAFGGDRLYALTTSDLHTLRFAGDGLEVLHTANSPASAVFPNVRLFVGGDLACAAHGDGYNVFDLSQPERPALVSAGTSPSAGWRQIVLNGSGEGVAIVAPAGGPGADADVSIYDVRQPAVTDAILATFPTPGLGRAVSLFNGLAYLADDASGLHVLNYLPLDRAGAAPTIRLATSFPENKAEEGKIFAVRALAADDVQVRNVEFHLDGRLAATDGNFPFEYRFVAPSILPGRDSFTLRARAFDTGGNSTWTDEVLIRLVPDATPPRIIRLAPADGAFARDVAQVSVVFTEPLDPSSVATSLTLRGAGPDGAFFTADDLTFGSNPAVFRPEMLTALFALGTPLAPGRYRLDVAAGLRDLAGNPLGTARSSAFWIFNLAGDSDGDCVPDSLEPALGLDPGKKDSNNNGVSDGDEDFDQDGLSNCSEILVTHSDPGNPDSDGDGIKDGNEDSDNDGIVDGEEVLSGKDGFLTNPLAADSDGDGVDDGVEIALGLDPTNPGDGQGDIIIDNRTVTLTGTARLRNLILQNGAILTHPAYTGAGNVGIHLVVSNLTIDATSAIDVSERGYPGGLSGYNNRSSQGRTRGNVSGSPRRSGGSYGGLGAVGNADSQVNDVYGDPFTPMDLGSGGGSDAGPGGSGGGRIRVTARNLLVEGAIRANGGNGSRYAGGGSGGSVALETEVLAGTGRIEATGGSGEIESSGGGGGRVSVVATSVNGPLLSQLGVAGGTGLRTAAPGTIYTRIGNQLSELVIRGTGAETFLPAGNPNGRLVLDGVRVAAGALNAAELRIINGAVLTHPPATTTAEFRLSIDVDTLVIDPGARIDVSGRGYLGGLSGANPDIRGRTAGNLPGSGARTGGSHGGLGGVGNSANASAGVYGDFRDPILPGGGGGSDGGTGSSGGGVVRIRARVFELNGDLLANGGDGGRFNAAGAGGSIRLEIDALTGEGALRANGGTVAAGIVEAAGGGGGRISIRYARTSGSALANAQTLPGSGFAVGGPGTLFLESPGATPLLIIRGAGRETPLPPGNLGVNVLLDTATVSSLEFGALDLSLTNGAVLTHPPATVNAEFALRLSVERLRVAAGSRVDVSGRGYLGGYSGSNGSDTRGRTGGNVPGSGSRTAGSHGGLGGVGNSRTALATVYGDYRNPNVPGGGGGSDGGTGASGGGVLHLDARTIELQGEILAHGGDGGRFNAPGAGGSIRIRTVSLTGDGSLRANGGNAISGIQESGGGGGGRIALSYTNATGLAFANVQAIPGAGYAPGGPGTVFLESPGVPPLLIIRGVGKETPLPEGTHPVQVVVDAATVSARQFGAAQLSLTRGAVLTHPAAVAPEVTRLGLTVGSLLIDETSRIDLTGRGFAGAFSRGNNQTFGLTVGFANGSFRRSGGSHAGLGGRGNAEGIVAAINGDYTVPDQPGGGGGADGGTGGDGGGVLHLVAQNVTVHGAIRANGAEGGRFGGGGGGGSLRIETDLLAGTGRLEAQGGGTGVGLSESGTGGGGRISLVFNRTEGSILQTASAVSSTQGHSQGASGTIYLQRGSEPGQLIVRGKGRESTAPVGPATHRLLVDQATLSATNLTFGEIRLVAGAVLTHPPATLTNTSRLVVRAALLEIDAGSRIDVSGRGYGGAFSLAGIGQRGQTLGHAEGSVRRVGGSYGGYGAFGNAEKIANEPYGSWRNPDEPGSGGGSDTGLGGNGGGVFILVADDLKLEGQILANGGEGGRFAGGGSGGALRLAVGTLRGTGTIRAHGGVSTLGLADAGGGGGGRIALQYTNALGFDLERIEAFGGPAGNGLEGTPGTLYLAGSGHGTPELVIHAGSRSPTRPTVLWSLAGREATALASNRLTDTNALWVPGALVGLELNPNTAQNRTFTIVANDATSILTDPADGDLRTVASGASPYAARLSVDRVFVRDQALLEIVDANRARPDRSGSLRASSVILARRAVVTHPAATLERVFGLDLAVSGLLTVDDSSRFDVSDRGYLGGLRAENGANQSGRTLGQAFGSTRRNGGGHGGSGALGNSAGTVNPTYGDPANPAELGSGGGSDSGPAGSGGGRLRLQAGEIVLDGRLLANGGDGARYAGGGSGGSLVLDTAFFHGKGIVSAAGGNSGLESGGGGGGRISIRTSRTADSILDRVSVSGGVGGTRAGEPGTFDRR